MWWVVVCGVLGLGTKVAQADDGSTPSSRPQQALAPHSASAAPSAIAAPALSNADGAAGVARDPSALPVAVAASAPSQREPDVALPVFPTAAPTPTFVVPQAVPPLVKPPLAIEAVSPPVGSSRDGHVADAVLARPAGSASARAPEAMVRILDRRVLPIRAARGGETAEARARNASRVLEKVLEEGDPSDVRVDVQGDVAVLYIGERPFLQLGVEDTAAAGDASVEVHANAVAAKVRDALKAERNRAAIAKQAFSFSLVVFGGLLAALLGRRARELLQRLGTWIDEHPDEVPRVEVRGLTLVGPAIVRGAVQVAVGGGRVFVVVALFVGWLLFSLSLWDSTRPYTGRLTAFLWEPVRSITERLVASLPATVIGLIALVAVALLVRFVGVFFRSVSEGETNLDWLPQDLAEPTGLLARVAVVLGSMAFLLPTLTGREDGAVARVGMLAMGALALAATPVLATTVMGIVVVYGRRLRVGEFAALGAHRGRVVEVGLLETRLESAEGEVRVPHLQSLLSPTVLLGRFPIVAVEVHVGATDARRAVEDALIEATQGVGVRPNVEILHTGPGGTRYRLSLGSDLADGRGRLLRSVLATLDEKNIVLGADGARVI